MKNDLTKAYIALALICIIWGTTYFFMRIGVRTIPPFLFSGVRQTLAGIILLLILKFSGRLPRIGTKNLMVHSFSGILMISLGNGIVGWSVQYIPSGLAALIVSIMPVYVVIIAYFSGADRRKPGAVVVSGLVLGCLGIFLMFRDNLSGFVNPEYLAGMLIAFTGALAWAIGSVISKFRSAGGSLLLNAAIQMLAGGFFLLIMSAVLDDYSNLAAISSESVWSLIYLLFIGSLLAYPCFMYALEKLPVGLSSIYAYINPFIALLLGAFFLHEKLTWITGVALLSAAGSIYLINLGYQSRRKQG